MNFIRSTFSPVEQMLAATAMFALILSLVSGGFPVASAQDNGNPPLHEVVKEKEKDEKVKICHATPNGYDNGKKEVDEDSITKESGHDSHDDGGADGRGDIIPPIGDYPGQNWDTAGKAIWENDCKAIEVPVCEDREATNYGEEGECEYDECDEVGTLTSIKDIDCDDDDTGYLKVWKYIVGTTTVSATNFSFKVNGGDSEFFPETGNEWNQYPFVIIEVPLDGTYSIVEDPADGFSTSYAITEGLEDTDTPDAIHACTDIELSEEDPYAYCRITNTVDMCPNIDGAQTEVPKEKYVNDAGQCVDIPRCDAGENDWADGFDDADQLKKKDGSAITDVNRTNPGAVTGEEDWDNGDSTGFYSLGFGGSIVVTFDHYVLNVLGDDLTVYEATNGDSYPEESVKVEVSQDGVVWKILTEEANNSDTATRATSLDFDETGFAWIKYVRLTDTTDPAPHAADADGFDVDAVRATETVCDEPGDEPRVCMVTLVSGTDSDAEDEDGYGEDDYTTVVQKSGAFAKLLSFVHPGWTAVIADAEWIWGDDPVAPPVVGATQTFVRTFGWNGTVADAKLYVAADNTYSSTINGDASGAETVDSNNFSSADEYDVDGLIDQGNNTLSINVVNTAGSEDPAGNPAGLLYKLVITTEDDVDCDVPYEESDDTTITVKKIVEDGDDEDTEFEFELNEESFANLAHNESHTEVVESGHYMIAELPIKGWDLEDVSCVNEDKEIVGSWEDGAWHLELEEGDDVTCVFENEEDDEESRVCRIGDNLIENGSFEDPAIDADWTISNAVVDWSYSTDGIEVWRNFNGSGAGLASDGFQNIELDGNSSTDVSQIVTTIPGAIYELRFDFSPRAGVLGNSLDARADGNLVTSASADGTGNSDNEWDEYTGTFVATDASTVISFEDTAVSDSLGTLLDNVVLCVTDDVPLYTIDGFKWNDIDGDSDPDEEPKLSGWVIEVTNGEDTYATTTDVNGYYRFQVPEGNWTVTEVQQEGWEQTYPDPEGQSEGACYAYFHDYYYDEYKLQSLDSVDDTSDDDYGYGDHAECNFGNMQSDRDPVLACDITASDTSIDEGDDVTIYWTSSLADEVTLSGNAVALNGSQVFEDMDENTTFTLVATDNFGEGQSTSVECSVTVEVDEDRGGSYSSGSRTKRSSLSSNDPIGEILGETTSVLPVGAPDTGAGGTSASPYASLITFFGMLMSLVTMRMTKNAS